MLKHTVMGWDMLYYAMLCRDATSTPSAPTPVPQAELKENKVQNKAIAKAKAKAAKESEKAKIKAAKAPKAEKVKGIKLVMKSTGKKVVGDTTEFPRKVTHATFGYLNAVYATGKSYIVAPGEDNKLHLFVEVRDKQTPNHAGMCAQIMKHSSKKNLSKADALAYRAKLLK